MTRKVTTQPREALRRITAQNWHLNRMDLSYASPDGHQGRALLSIFQLLFLWQRIKYEPEAVCKLRRKMHDLMTCLVNFALTFVEQLHRAVLSNSYPLASNIASTPNYLLLRVLFCPSLTLLYRPLSCFYTLPAHHEAPLDLPPCPHGPRQDRLRCRYHWCYRRPHRICRRRRLS